MLASVVSFLLLSVSPIEGGFSTEYMGTKGLLASFVAAFLTVNLYKFCVLKDITIKMPKEVPGTIRKPSEIFSFLFSVFAAVLIDLGIRQIFQISFAEAIITVLQPLFTAADGYLGIAIIWERWRCFGLSVFMDRRSWSRQLRQLSMPMWKPICNCSIPVNKLLKY